MIPVSPSLDPEDLGTIGEVAPEFAFWLDDQESLAGKAAVLAIAVAKAWIITPPAVTQVLLLKQGGPGPTETRKHFVYFARKAE